MAGDEGGGGAQRSQQGAGVEEQRPGVVESTARGGEQRLLLAVAQERLHLPQLTGRSFGFAIH